VVTGSSIQAIKTISSAKLQLRTRIIERRQRTCHLAVNVERESAAQATPHLKLDRPVESTSQVDTERRT
jgi:hypothetical protein